MKDALDKELVIGNIYGWATNSNGFTRVTIGELVKINSKKVSLKVLERKTALYDRDFQPQEAGHIVTVYSRILFPI